jgi:hypothetical protein
VSQLSHVFNLSCFGFEKQTELNIHVVKMQATEHLPVRGLPIHDIIAQFDNVIDVRENPDAPLCRPLSLPESTAFVCVSASLCVSLTLRPNASI